MRLNDVTPGLRAALAAADTGSEGLRLAVGRDPIGGAWAASLMMDRVAIRAPGAPLPSCDERGAEAEPEGISWRPA